MAKKKTSKAKKSPSTKTPSTKTPAKQSPAKKSPPKKRAGNAAATKSGKKGSSRPKRSASSKAAAAPRRESGGDFLVVGVGASAGGLGALTRFFRAMPASPGMAFVVIQHLDPTKESLTAELLGKHTQMRVAQVEDEPRIAPNCVYVIPPNKYLSVDKGMLHLSEPEHRRSSRVPIDFFLRSLAEQTQARAAAVILSGSGTDGSLGIKAVKAQGGLVVAQDPGEADFSGMPHSAIATGVVDFILPVGKIPETLTRYAHHPHVRAIHCDGDDDGVLEQARSELKQILNLLRARSKYDFHCYKDGTLLRRTRRRMGLQHIGELPEYLEFLREHPQEVDALVKDMLISVTDFFREPEAWELLDERVIAPLVEAKPPDAPIRVWVPGCATGEEPYSVGMLLLEHLQRAEKNCPLQIFASDIDRDALEYARHASYPDAIKADVSPQRLRRFFEHVSGDHHYRVNKPLREAVVFAEQNLIGDPPFSKLDLICCRNLMIYLRAEVQQKLIALFHFALTEGGHLFLGNAETVGRHEDLFTPVSKKSRIYRRIGPTQHDKVEFPIALGQPRRDAEVHHAPAARRDVRLAHLAQARLLDWLAPPAVLVNRNWQIVFFCGDTDPFLTHSPGAATQDLLSKARPGLRTKLRGAAQKALEGHEAVSVDAHVKRDGHFQAVQITARALKDPENEEVLVLIVFDEQPDPPAARDAGKGKEERRDPSEIDGEDVIRHLEDELAATKEDLQTSVDQLETSNEEFKAANEEVMSINEELQSTNEELETSKEELQSLNEELNTVNNQLALKVDELERQHDDLSNLVSSTDIATICLDRELCIKWFTPATTGLMNIQTSDIGRPLADFAHRFANEQLLSDARQVLEKLTPIETEVRTTDDRTFLRRVVPFRTEDDRIAGVVITFFEITRRLRAEVSLRDSEARLRAFLDNSAVIAWMKDETGRYTFVGNNCQRFFHKNEADWLGKTDMELFPPEIAEALRRNDQQVLQSNQGVEVLEKSLDPDGSPCWWLSSKFPYEDEEGRRFVGGVAVNMTERHRAEEQLRASEVELRGLNETLEQHVAERTEMLRILQDITRAANEARTVDEALGAAMRRIAQYNGWQVGHVWQLAGDGSGAMVSTGIWHVGQGGDLAIGRLDEFQQICRETRYLPGEILIGSVASAGEPRWLDDIAASPDWRRGDAAELGLHAVIAFPIFADHAVVAVMEFFSDHPARRDDRFMEIMPDVGIQLGHVIQRKMLERDVAEIADREQRRMGQEMHDGLSQQLAGVSLLMEGLTNELEEEQSSHADEADRIRESLAEAARQCRALTKGLLPVEIDREGLMSALEEFVERTGDAYDIDCRFECMRPVLVDDSFTATHLYRIACEAVHNAVKHAEADSIQVRLNDDGNETLLIADDGVGIDDAARVSGDGIRIMQHRAGLIGAKLTIESSLGEGTRVICRFG